MHKFTVPSGEEVIESLGKQFADAGIRNGAMVSIIGALESCEIHTMVPMTRAQI